MLKDGKTLSAKYLVSLVNRDLASYGTEYQDRDGSTWQNVIRHDLNRIDRFQVA